ncbi:dTMP kinase [Acidocella sp.]|uniref:dTMP kinase n=1 Tax=Acidocella sp. TaxID=50710 RepID=UPI002604571B|nr:dTMP kinase [Acidocella sp.]
MSPGPGLLITLEGGEGAGKSTAARNLAALLREAGHEVVLTREPGGTPGAEAIRTLLLGGEPLSPEAQTLLHFAARTDHAAALIRPALARGAIVVCDRFYDSTMAYQHYGQNVPRPYIEALTALLGLTPDLTCLLHVAPEIARARVRARNSGSDRYDAMGAAFFARVEAGFTDIAAREPARFARIEADAPPAEVAARLRALVRERFGR